MQIVNYFRAKILHSSNAAFSLAIKNNKHLSFAEKIISVKNDNVRCDIINTHYSMRKEILFKSKILKYEHLLENIKKIKSQLHKNSDILNHRHYPPRLAVIKTNENDHEYCYPYNNQLKINENDHEYCYPYSNQLKINENDHEYCYPYSNQLKINENDHEYCYPYNNQPQYINLTTAKESFV